MKHYPCPDVLATETMLGRSQRRSDLPHEGWLSRDLLASYSGSRPVDWEVMSSSERWAAPLMRAHFSAETSDAVLRMHASRSRLFRLLAQLPKTVCHLDVCPNNIFRRPDGEVVLVDWAFVGEGIVGEDIGNLVPDSVFDLFLPAEVIGVLAERLPSAYLRGLSDAGWEGDERPVRIGICASGIKYDWLTAFCLERAETDAHLDYGGRVTVDADAPYAARAAELALCARWSDEALRLAREVGLDA